MTRWCEITESVYTTYSACILLGRVVLSTAEPKAINIWLNHHMFYFRNEKRAWKILCNKLRTTWGIFFPVVFLEDWQPFTSNYLVILAAPRRREKIQEKVAKVKSRDQTLFFFLLRSPHESRKEEEKVKLSLISRRHRFSPQKLHLVE